MTLTPRITTPPRDGTQSADSPAVEWLDNRPYCASCGSALNAGSTVSPKHTADLRPLRVQTCPMECQP